ncbi:hypothetical protein GGR53DRAFT_471678 [Hypoxylon sp. FL1150]|nr:hypothetical protein GGR53DRAFT_471678 [Hypoxylon sp. FL1150]
MSSNKDIVSREFELDVFKRGVLNPSASDPCKCGYYQYQSMKCGCIFKGVYLKCGRVFSSKTGAPILCKQGHGRRVQVHDAVVPFYCKECRDSGVRWKGQKADQDHQQDGEVEIKDEDDDVIIKEED